MDDLPPDQIQEPGNLRFLRRLVTVLTATMILGMLVVVTLLVLRFNQSDKTIPLPDAISLPDGTKATAFTRGSNWYAVVTEDNQILIFDIETGALRQTLEIAE